MRKIECIGGLLFATVVFPVSAREMRAAVVSAEGHFYFQESGTVPPLGKLNVPSKAMAERCTTMVTPTYSQPVGDAPKVSTVVVRVVIWKSGGVSPLRVVSGDSLLETPAMNAVRLWHYRPYVRNGEPMDVTTNVRIDFAPGKPGGIVTHPNP